jgi:hypothetical protein
MLQFERDAEPKEERQHERYLGDCKLVVLDRVLVARVHLRPSRQAAKGLTECHPHLLCRAFEHTTASADEEAVSSEDGAIGAVATRHRWGCSVAHVAVSVTTRVECSDGDARRQGPLFTSVDTSGACLDLQHHSCVRCERERVRLSPPADFVHVHQDELVCMHGGESKPQ